jgi:translation initiation factor 1
MANRRTGSSSRLIYSSRSGRVCPGCGHPLERCSCQQAPRAPRGDGVVRVRREVKGRKGKGVTTISGVPLASDALRNLASELKKLCSSGGSLKEGVIEIQGDHRDRVAQALRERGYTVKLAGG